MKNTIMFHLGRSGSTVLADMLNQHPGINWYGELYERTFQKWERENGKLRIGSNNCLLAHYAPIKKLRDMGDTSVHGIEVKPYHLRHQNIAFQDYIDTVEKLGISRFILVERKNILRKIVSSQVAIATGQWHIRAGKNDMAPNRIKINCARLIVDRQENNLISHLEMLDHDLQRLKQVLPKNNTLHLTYEDDIEKSPLTAYHKAIDFLELPSYDAKVSLMKINTRSLSETVTNYVDLCNYLSETRFSWMCQE